MNTSETLFMETIEDHVIISDVQGNIYGMGFNTEDCITDAMDNGICEEDLEGLPNEDCPWMNDDEEDY